MRQLPLVRRTKNPLTYLKRSDVVRQVSQLYLPNGKVILKPCGFSEVLFTSKLPKAILLGISRISLPSNTTRRKANKTGQVPLRTLGQMHEIFLAYCNLL